MNSFEYLPLLLGLSIAPMLVAMIVGSAKRHRELGRFSDQHQRWWNFFVHDLRRYASYRTSLQAISRVHRSISPRDAILLRRAGISTQQQQTRYLIVRESLLAAALLVSVCVVGAFSAKEISLGLLPMIVAAVWGPKLWLHSCARRREDRSRREGVILLEIVKVASARGWSVESTMNKLAEIYHRDRYSNPLAERVCRGRWYSLVGGTFQEGLRAMNLELGRADDTGWIVRLADMMDHPASQVHAQLATLSSEVVDDHLDYLRRQQQIFASALIALATALSCGAGVLLVSNSFQG